MKVNGFLANNYFRDGLAVTRTSDAAGPEGTPQTSQRKTSDAAQLSMLGSVLNGLEMGASANKRQIGQLTMAIRSGSYSVDSLAVSSRIVTEALTAGTAI